jgi:hypothetical protein
MSNFLIFPLYNEEKKGFIKNIIYNEEDKQALSMRAQCS